MNRKKGTFRYIDKDKIIPYLDDQIDGALLNDDITWANAMTKVRDLICDGFFDFQQGSE